jgi:hypothetical protein
LTIAALGFRAVGVVITAVSGALARARRRIGSEIEFLSMSSAAGLTVIDIVYVAKRRIAPVYLLDVAVELAVIGGWLAAGGGADRG